MAERRASDVFVDCLESEGVRYVFGIPGEETLDLNESLAGSSIAVRPGPPRAGRRLHGRHLRPADRARRRLPRHARPGRNEPHHCRSPTPSSTARRWSRSPARATSSGCTRSPTSTSTSCASCGRSPSGTPSLTAPAIIPEVVRKAFKLAESEKPGATHIELPEDVMARAARRRSRFRAAAAPPAPSPARRELAARRRHHPLGRPTRSCSPATAWSAVNATRRPARVRPRRPASPWPRPSWARASSTTRTSTSLGTVGPPGRATTRWPASRTPTW